MEFETVWSAAMERAGTARGLCSFGELDAQSTLSHSIASWETLEHGEVKSSRRKRQTAARLKDAAILELLKRGLRRSHIERALGVSNSVVLRVARCHGYSFPMGRPSK